MSKVTLRELPDGTLERTVLPPDTDDLLAHLADKAWQVETSGTVVNGVRLPTSREHRSALKDARDMLRDGELLDTQGHVLTTMDVTIGNVGMPGVTAEVATQMLMAIGRHVQACFALRQALLAAIQNGIVTTFEQIEAPETVGLSSWPSNV